MCSKSSGRARAKEPYECYYIRIRHIVNRKNRKLESCQIWNKASAFCLHHNTMILTKQTRVVMIVAIMVVPMERDGTPCRHRSWAGGRSRKWTGWPRRNGSYGGFSSGRNCTYLSLLRRWLRVCGWCRNWHDPSFRASWALRPAKASWGETPTCISGNERFPPWSPAAPSMLK